jgi:N-acetylglutamate synthase-like GNAT family acetyltransferase
MRIEPGPNIADVKRLLTAADLPTEDLTVDQMAHFIGAEIEGTLAGVVGAVPCGGDALLRSLAVSAPHRAKGVGSQLVAAAEKHALNLGARRIYLLTLTAETFFRARGYLVVPREMAPGAVRSTEEFVRLCPASSVLMCRQLVNH